MEIPYKTAKTNKTILTWCTTIVSITCILSILIGILVLLGWKFNLPYFIAISKMWTPMVPNVAVCFILTGLSLFLLKSEKPGLKKRITAFILIFPVLLISILTSFEYLTNINLGIDTILFKNAVIEKVIANTPGRMSEISAASFILLSLALLFIDKKILNKWIYQALCFIAALLTLFVLFGYLYEANEVFINIRTALMTAVLFLLLSIAILLARPQRGLINILVQNSIGRSSLRNIILFTLLIPVFVGYIRFFGNSTYEISAGLSLALIMLGLIIIFIAVEWRNVSIQDKYTQKLTLSDQRLTLALQSAHAGVWSWNIQRDEVVWDNEMHRLYKIELNATPKHYSDFLNLVHPDDRKKVEYNVSDTLNNDKPYEVSFRIKTKDNEKHYIGCRAKVYQDKFGRPTYMMGVCWDITKQRLAEDEMKKAKEIAEEASRLKTNFMAKISHDLRSPLNGIIGFAELMYHGKVGTISEAHKEYLSDILTSARHLLLLINDVLDISKVESGKMEFFPEKIDINKILDETKDIFHTLIETKHLSITCEVDPTLNKVTIDPARFKQVLYNYVSNALKYTPDNGKVIVRILPEKNSHSFKLEVEDNGIGIRKEDLNRLFVEFQQLEPKISKKYPSTGLGLALTKHIVEAQGGKVGVESEYEKGSKFFAILPNSAKTA